MFLKFLGDDGRNQTAVNSFADYLLNHSNTSSCNSINFLQKKYERGIIPSLILTILNRLFHRMLIFSTIIFIAVNIPMTFMTQKYPIGILIIDWKIVVPIVTLRHNMVPFDVPTNFSATQHTNSSIFGYKPCLGVMHRNSSSHIAKFNNMTLKLFLVYKFI